ncbi:unannotated protein [freshwater metagenome]|uniref:Unannotated protein n=1 Tax=freshwater metagenome TaxID=449393 RepID=A0A6J6QE83_9ZZZZ
MRAIQIEQVCTIKRECLNAITDFTGTRFHQSDVGEIKNSLATYLIKEQNAGHGIPSFIDLADLTS